MSKFQEAYSAQAMAVDATFQPGSFIAGFLAKTSGTFSLTGPSGTVLIDAVSVTAGVYTPLPFFTGGPGAVVTLSGGASGTLAYGN